MKKYMLDEKMIGQKTDTLMSLMYKMNENTNGIVFILDDENKFIGVITDGDIKRALLSGHNLSEMAEEYINLQPSFAWEEESNKEVKEKFDGKIKMIPILTKNREVVGYYKDENIMPIADPELNGNELNYLLDAFVSTWISSSGYYINRFEQDFAEYCGTKYGVAVSNGTVALHLALIALGIGVGDEVIVPDLTFAATINAVLYTGATPVIVDIEEDSWCIDPLEIEKAITKKTKAIIPVHLYGQPCRMDEICKLAKQYGLYIVEDCAEAHGAEFDGQKVGSFSDIACFSFFGNKVITTGEGGMCLTNSLELEQKMRQCRDHGMSKERRYYHEVLGYNYRMTNLQAAIGVGQLERIDSILGWREQLEELYISSLANCENVILQQRNLAKRKKVTWLVSILVSEAKRMCLIDELKKIGIDSRAFFIPLSKMELYKKYAIKPCKVSERISLMGINLPTNYRVSEEVVQTIVEVINRL